MRSALLATAAVSLSLAATEASAHGIHRHSAYQHRRQHHVAYRRSRYGAGSSYGSNVAAARARGLAWCGAEMADELGIGGREGRELWVARNWARVGAPTSAHIGAVVVWPHHVGRIVGQENGQWVVQSGNDGGGVRSRARSLAGAIAIRDVGSSSAVASSEPNHHYQHASLEHRTPLWMYEETAQPTRFGAASES